MPFQITNSSDGPVLVRLRSGATVHLAIGERSPELAESEISNNPRIEPLLDRRLITLHEVHAPPRGGRRRTQGQGKGKGRGKATAEHREGTGR